MIVLAAAAAALLVLAQGVPPIPTPEEIEREVLENVKQQPLGDGTIEDLALPEEFLRRVADRAVRSSYEERYRIVVPGMDSPVRGETGARSRSAVALAAAGVLALGGLAWILIARRAQRASA